MRCGLWGQGEESLSLRQRVALPLAGGDWAAGAGCTSPLSSMVGGPMCGPCRGDSTTVACCGAGGSGGDRPKWIGVIGSGRTQLLLPSSGGMR